MRLAFERSAPYKSEFVCLPSTCHVARVVAFFASDDSGYMTGTYAPVDGGLVIGG
jgi:NAD(P)-dependent dehydrogenase (short-subunit alcohol dehydrogenase family)